MAPEGLPRAFLQSLRPLYDILDDRRRGYVHLREIESRWLQPSGEAGQLPRGVLEGLRRAAPPSGYLTFERFVLGLRLSLLSSEQGGSPADAPPPRESSARQGGGAPRSHDGCAERPLQGKRAAGEAGGSRKPVEQLEHEGPCKEARRQPSVGVGHRRHTIANGVDHEMMKQLKELEKAEDFLLQGLQLAEGAREWYRQRIRRLQEQQEQLGRSRGHRGTRTQLNHLFPQGQELNRCLWLLLTLSKGPQQTIHMLKEQNRLLTKEVTDKGHRITQLEQEKSALIKQLFGARAQNSRDANLLDSTFI